MALTPEEVVNKRFQPTKFREGYDQDEVDDFLDEVVGELRRLGAENDELRQKLAACERRVGELTRAGAADDVPQDGSEDDEQQQPAAPRQVTPAARVPAPSTAAAPAAASTASPNAGQGPEAAAGVLALAQKLHDDYVRSGEEQRDQIVGEAKEHAARLVAEAEGTKTETLGALERERSLLERKIDELRAFERDYRARLKAYLESQLRELQSSGSQVPPAGPGSREAAVDG